jgi:O-methyltransferase domain/Dimerisation domain
MPKARRPRAQETMLEMVTGFWVSQLLFVATRLGIADHLARGALAVDELAKRTGAHAPSLRRILRALASVGVFAETSRGTFRLTPLAATLRSDQPGSLRDFTLMMADGYNVGAWTALEHGVRTGELPFDHVYGKPLFGYLHDHPELESRFMAAMSSISATENAAVARAYPFGRIRKLVDVGGAHGHLLATILARHGKVRGVLYDQPQVVAGAAASGFVKAPAVRDRCDVVGGDFFQSVPAGADGYVMKYIVHDWDDAKATRILRNCRAAMAPDGVVLVVDHVIPPGNARSWGKLLDVNMLVMPGGMERTREEFRDLLAAAGLRMRRIVATACPLSVVEAVAA